MPQDKNKGRPALWPSGGNLNKPVPLPTDSDTFGEQAMWEKETSIAKPMHPARVEKLAKSRQEKLLSQKSRKGLLAATADEKRDTLFGEGVYRGLSKNDLRVAQGQVRGEEDAYHRRLAPPRRRKRPVKYSSPEAGSRKGNLGQL